MAKDLVKNPDVEIGVLFQISWETSKIKAANQVCWVLETYLTARRGVRALNLSTREAEARRYV